MSTVRELMAAGTQTILAQALVGSVTRSATATGTTQADALPFDTGAIYVTTTASGTGVRLVGTTANPATIGDQQTVYNFGANTLSVYPPVGETISGNAINAASSLAPNTSCTFKKVANLTWVPGAGSTAADITFIQSGTGAVARTAQAKMRETVSVLDFGADNTGVTDAASAITAAQAALPTAGGRVYFPAGTYKIASSITLKQNVIYYGDGMLATTIAPTTAVTGAAFTLILGSLQTGALEIRDIGFSGNATTLYAISLKNMTLVTLRRLYFDGFTNASSEQVLLDFIEASSVVDCAFLNCRTNGLRLTDAANAFLIDGCTFTTTNSGAIGCTIDPSVAQVTVSNCNFEGASAGNIGLVCNGSQAVTIKGNFFEFWTGAAIGANSGTASNLRIEDNHLHATSAASAMVALNSSGPNDRVICDNNLLALLGNAGTSTVGFDFGTTTNVRAVGNKSTGSGTGIVRVNGVTLSDRITSASPGYLVTPARTLSLARPPPK